MREYDLHGVEFYSTDNLANVMYLSEAEPILWNSKNSAYEDINDFMKLYNIKQFIDAEVYLKIWTQDDIEIFKQQVNGYGKIIGIFMSNINDGNAVCYHKQLFVGYVESF